jgi:hypothetical protein
MNFPHGSDLQPQAFRISRRARDRIAALATEELAAGSVVTPAGAARGLCLLALDLALGLAGEDAANAFRRAAIDPSAPALGRAVDAFLELLDVDVAETRSLQDARALERTFASGRVRGELLTQALRLPHDARDQLEAFAVELRASGADVTVSATTRGLFLLALDLAFGFAGPRATRAFRLAASDPTAEGVRRALSEVQCLLEAAPSTTPDPPMSSEGAITTRRGDSSPPSTIPNFRAA